jgi:integrase
LYDKKESGLSKHTLEGHKGTLTKALKMAVHPYKIINENPCQYITMPRYNEVNQTKESEKIVSLTDWKKIRKRFPETNHFGVILNILYYTALRESECLGLTWDDINLNNKTMSVNHQLLVTSLTKGITATYIAPLKTGSSYSDIILGDAITEILKATQKRQAENKNYYGEYYTLYYKDKNNKVYPLPASKECSDERVNFVCVKENGELLNQGSLKYCARIIHHELNIKNFTFHRLRHTHASILISNGANIKAVKERLRHQNISTTLNTYSHLLKETEEQTAQLFDELTSTKN